VLRSLEEFCPLFVRRTSARPCRATWSFVSFAAVTLVGHAASAATITKGPYLQSLDSTEVTVKLELDELEKASIEVFAKGATKPVFSRTSKETHRLHTLRVEGLEPSTTYEYRVTVGDAKSEIGHFTTAPADSRPFRFLLYGDSRSDNGAHAAIVRALETAPGDFLVNTGDMVAVGTDATGWRTFFEIEGKLLRDRCVFASVGNHELLEEARHGGAAFLRYFADVEDGRDRKTLYGSFRWSNTRFFLLNAMDVWTGEEREWLRAELDRAMDEPGLVHRFAVLHQGPFSSGPHGGNRALIEGGVLEIMRDRKVDLILAGHDHVYERGEGEGLKYLISGGAGAPLYPKERRTPQTLAFESVHHFVEIEVDGEQVKTVARRASGSVIESCSFQGKGSWDCGTSTKKTSATPVTPAEPKAPPKVPQQAGASGCGCSVPGDSGALGPWRGAAAFIAAALGLARKRARGAGRRRAA